MEDIKKPVSLSDYKQQKQEKLEAGKTPEIPEELKQYSKKIREAVMKVREDTKEKSETLEEFKKGEKVFCLGLFSSSKDILVKCMDINKKSNKLKVLDIAADKCIIICEDEIDNLDEVTEKNIDSFDFLFY